MITVPQNSVFSTLQINCISKYINCKMKNAWNFKCRIPQVQPRIFPGESVKPETYGVTTIVHFSQIYIFINLQLVNLRPAPLDLTLVCQSYWRNCSFNLSASDWTYYKRVISWITLSYHIDVIRTEEKV